MRASTAPTHDLIRVSGADAVSFLDGLLSQDIGGLEAGHVRRSFLLAPNGKLRALLWAVRHEGSLQLIADASIGEVVKQDLERFKLRVDVDIGAPTPLWSVLDEEPDDAIAVPLGAIDRWLVTERPTAAAALADAELDAMRIEAGEPVMGIDVDESTIPQETGLVTDAVDFTKGCYLGQELVARIDSRGHVNRRLAAVLTEAPMEAGATVAVGERPAGALTTVARGGKLAMGLLRREAEVGGPVTVATGAGEVPGVVTEVPIV